MREMARIIIVILFALATTSGRADAAPVELGQAAPKLIAKSIDGQTIDLATLQGHVVVINFWATWCAPCREEMPALDKVFQHYRAQGVELIGLSIDKLRDRDTVLKIMKNFTYQAALAREATENGFDIPNALPQTYVLDRQGRIRKIFGGDDPTVTEKGLSDALDPLLTN